MDTVGKRLKDERARLGLSQDEFAAVGGLARRTQTHYESDTRSPDIAYLHALATIGVDIVYVLTGDRAVAWVNEDESEILSAYRQLNDAGKGFIQNMLASYVNNGSLAADGQPATPDRRVKRLPENRRAALDERTAENIDKALEVLEQARKVRARRNVKSTDES